MALLGFSAGANGLFGQNSYQDSLRNVMATARVDSLFLEAELQLARSYFGTDLDSVLVLGEDLRERARRSGELHYRAEGENTMGIARLFQGRNGLALRHFQVVLSLRRRLGVPEDIAGACNNVALAHQELGEFGQALRYHLQSLEIKESLADTARIRVSQNNIGLIYEQLEDYPAARGYYRRAVTLVPLAEDTVGYSTPLFNVGVTYFKEGHPDSARLVLAESYPLVQATGDLRMMGLHHLYFGRMDQLEEKWDRAEEKIRKALSLFEAIGKQDKIAAARTALGTNYLLQGKPRPALQECQLAWELADDMDNLRERASCLECLHESYAALGLKAKAYDASVELLALQDSLATGSRHRQIVRQDLAYGYQKRQLADSLAHAHSEAMLKVGFDQELKAQQSITFLMILIGTLLLGLVVFFYFNSRSKKQHSLLLEERVRERTKVLEQQKEQLAEYAFINAHLLRQPLTQILGLVELIRQTNDLDEAARYLEMLYHSAEKMDQVIHEIRDVVEEERHAPQKNIPPDLSLAGR